MPVYGYVLIGVAALILLLVAVVSMRPAEFRVSRSATMAATPGTVFAQVNDFHNWDEWSPWAKLDPGAKNSFDGPAAGVGAVFAWDGNKHVGAGRMTITDSVPDSLIRINLEFFRPMKATNLTEFTFAPAGDQTEVTWTMTGRNGFVGKFFCLLMNLDKMVGKDFDKGLASVKGIVEGDAPPRTPSQHRAPRADNRRTFRPAPSRRGDVPARRSELPGLTVTARESASSLRR